MDTPRRELALEFTASGSEYFRIWVVNLLLIVVTLGFYLPFAKARRLRYFYANTLIDQQALAFHGDPWKMFKGYLLMWVLFGAYALAGHFSPWLAMFFFLLLAALWPALWRSSLRFRLFNTSWRGLRFGFEGSAGDAYRALLPLFVPGLVFMAANAYFLNGIDNQDADAMNRAVMAQLPWTLLGMALLLVLFPYCLYLLKRYAHQGFRYAGQASRFNATHGVFYKLGLKAIGLSLLCVFSLGVVVALGAGAAIALPRGGGTIVGIGLSFAVVLLYMAILVTIQSYYAARMQDLSWNATQSQALAFTSRLGARTLAKLQFKNLLLTVFTLGLYRPFAVVNTHRLRWLAMGIAVEGDIDTWQAVAGKDASASGEMAGDFFGIDMGL